MPYELMSLGPWTVIYTDPDVSPPKGPVMPVDSEPPSKGVNTDHVPKQVDDSGSAITVSPTFLMMHNILFV